METNRLKQILSGAKTVMDTVESGNYNKGNIDPSILTVPENLVETIPSHQMESNTYQEKEMPYRNLHTTKMPKEIVEAMIKTPIPRIDSPYHTFELTEDLLNDINPSATKKPQKIVNSPQKSVSPQQRAAEVKRNSVMGITEEEVREIVRDEMEQIIYKYFDQRVIKEDIQIKVGNTIFSGKLSPLPGKKVNRK